MQIDGKETAMTDTELSTFLLPSCEHIGTADI